MSAPPTLVINEDDERTIVDPHIPTSRPASDPDMRRSKQVIGHWATSLRDRWRPILAGVAGWGLCLSVVAVALHQRRLAERLQRTIDTMQTAAPSPRPVQSTPTQMSKEPRTSVPADPRATVVEAKAVDREDLELEAATLVVANDYRAALESYRVLAQRFPGERSFSDLITILRAKVSCQGNREVEAFHCD